MSLHRTYSPKHVLIAVRFVDPYDRARHDGEYIEQCGKRCHYTTFILARHVLIAVRFVDPYGGLNATIAGMLFDLGMPHLASIGLSEYNSTGHTSIGSEGVSSIATGAITLAKQATDKVAEMAKIVHDLNSFKKETTAENIIVNGTSAKIANKMKGIIKDATDSATTLSEMEARLRKLESKPAKPRELTTKETESITRMLMPQIKQAVQIIIRDKY